LPLFVLPFPAIDPVLISVGPLSIRWYALSYIVGIFIGWWYARTLAGNQRLWGPNGSPMKPADIDDFVVWATVGIILGGRLGFVLFYDLPHYIDNPGDILAIWHGGMSFHGGLLGTMLAMFLFARSRKIPVWSLFDVIGASVPPGILLVRLANFINGELWGKPTDLPWAMVFPNAGPEPRHPSPLYEGLLEGLILFLILRYLTHGMKRLQQPGFVAGAFAAWYGASRIFVEFFRVPDVQIGYLWGPLTLGMLLSIPLLVIGIGLMIWASRKTPATAGAQ
jgi:phosphatidylglycerol:prolipoprotein diacylglycerol transferase